MELAAGYNHTCAILIDAQLRCWGWNAAGQLGDGTNTDSPMPVVIGALDGVKTMAAGAFHTCAAASGGAVTCWGSNDSGQLGDGTNTDRAAPVHIEGVVL